MENKPDEAVKTVSEIDRNLEKTKSFKHWVYVTNNIKLVKLLDKLNRTNPVYVGYYEELKFFAPQSCKEKGVIVVRTVKNGQLKGDSINQILSQGWTLEMVDFSKNNCIFSKSYEGQPPEQEKPKDEPAPKQAPVIQKDQSVVIRDA